MAERILTLLEVTGIQSYIFGSNQLAQNIGASELVARATTKYIVDILGNQTNAFWDENQPDYGPGIQYDNNRSFDEIQAEVIYAGGGNAMLLFHTMEKAVAFVKTLSRKLLKEAPGLKLVAAHKAYEHDHKAEDAKVLADEHHALRGELAHRKRDHVISAPLLGQSVTAECVYTGLPAVGYDNDEKVVGEAAARKIKRMGKDYPARLISNEVKAKLEAESIGNERLHNVLPKVRQQKIQGRDFGFIYDFSELGEPGESSYIAVVHADGNQMGKRFELIRNKHNSPDKNDAYIEDLRQFSLGVRKRAKRALEKTVQYIFDSLPNDKNWTMDSVFGGVVRIPKTKGGSPLLPFRPIVFGGDDITFVCDGRLGLDLAAYYLNAFCEEDHAGEEIEGDRVYARAGIAVVKTHYPFSRAYDLAEALAAQAKKAIIDLKASGQQSATVMDWHFATTGKMYELKEIRDREYRDNNAPKRSMLMRPVTLEENPAT